MSGDGMKRVYLAGKVHPLQDWRESIVPEHILYTYTAEDEEFLTYLPSLNIVYAGPYLIRGKSHDYTADVSHGSPGVELWEIHKNCLAAIDASDIVFAWLDDTSAHGTMIELGYAKAKGKEIWIAGPDLREVYQDDEGVDICASDPLWFAYELADELCMNDDEHQALTPFIAFTLMLSDTTPFGSPIEKMFWRAWKRFSWSVRKSYPLVPQYQIGRYRVDFAHVSTRTVIELDGFESHSSTDDIARDRKRQREIEALGWHVIRFGGKEIHRSVIVCVQEAFSLIDMRCNETNYSHFRKRMPVDPAQRIQARLLIYQLSTDKMEDTGWLGIAPSHISEGLGISYDEACAILLDFQARGKIYDNGKGASRIMSDGRTCATRFYLKGHHNDQ